MKSTKITILDSDKVIVPSEIKMSIVEIAVLFGIYYQTAKRTIRAIEKSGIADGDYSMSCSVNGENIYPDYYGLEMVIAVAFRVQSKKANIFRQWVCRRTDRNNIYSEIILLTKNVMPN